GGRTLGARIILRIHSSSGGYGADRQLRLLATGFDPDRYKAVVVLPEPGPLAEQLHDDGVEVLVRPLAVIRRELMGPRGLGLVLARALRDAVALGRFARRRGVALVHSNTSVVLGGV